MNKKTKKIMKPFNVMATAAIVSSTFTFSPANAEIKSAKLSKPTTFVHQQYNIAESEFKSTTELVKQGYTRSYVSNDTDFRLDEAIIFEGDEWDVDDKGLILRENLSDSLQVIDREYVTTRHDVNDKSIFGVFINDTAENNGVSSAGVGQTIKVFPGATYDINVAVRGLKAPGSPGSDYNLKAIIKDPSSETDYTIDQNFTSSSSLTLENSQKIKMTGDTLQIGAGVQLNELQQNQRSAYSRLQTEKSSVQLEGPSILKAQYVTKRVEGESIPNATVRIKLASGKVYETVADASGAYTFTGQELEEGTVIEVQQEIDGVTSKSTTEAVESALTYVTNIVDKLFTNDQDNELENGVTQNQISDAKDLVELHLSGEQKENLLKRVDTAQALFTATESVASLQDADGHLLPSKDRADINASQELVQLLPEGPTKKQLGATLEKLMKELEVREELEKLERAKKMVDELYTNDQYNELKKDTVQLNIDDAASAVDELKTSTEKDALQDLLTTAQQLLDAINLVDSLSDTSGDILPDVTQKEIDDAKKTVALLPDGPTKIDLERKLDDLQKQLEEIALIAIDSVNSVEETDSVVTGTVKEKVNKVHIYLNDELIRIRPVDKEKGTFIGHVSNSLKANDKITVIPQGESGRMGVAVDILVKETIRVNAPTLDDYQEGKERLTGEVSENTSYVRIYVNGTHVRKRNVEDNGDLMAYILDVKPQKDDVIKVVPYDQNNRRGEEASIVVKERSLLLDKYVEGDELIFGNTELNASKIELYANNEFIGLGKIDPETGEFRANMRLNNALPKAGDRIEAVSYNELGEKSLSRSITVEESKTIKSPKVKEYTANDSLIKGKVGPETVKLRLYHGVDFKQVVNRGVILANNDFKFYALDLGLKKGETVRMVSVDKNGRESATTNITVK